MDATNSSLPDVSARSTNWAMAFLLGVGPALCVAFVVMAISDGRLTTLSPTQYLVTMLLFWSPLPFSVPAVLLERHRDAALPSVRGLLGWPLRAVLLMPYLLTSPKSQVRVETAASLVGFGIAVCMAFPHLSS